MAEKTVYIIDLDDRVKNKLKGVQDSAKKTDSIFSSLGGSVAGVFAGLASGAAIISIVNTTAKVQSLSNAIRFASDSATQGELSMQWLSNFSNKWGVSLNAATEGFRTFQGAMIKTKFTSNEVRKMFEQVSMGGIAMGLSAEDTKGTFLALGQIMGKGKVQAEELRGQIGERVPGAFAIAARAMGVTTAQLDKMMSTGQLLAEDFLPKFAEEMSKTFSSGAIDNVDSMTSNINRLGSAWLELQVAMGSSQGGLINDAIKGWSIGLGYIADQFRTIDQLANRSSNKGSVDLLAYMENDMRNKRTEMLKSGKSKSEIETALNYQTSSTKNAWQQQIEQKQSEVSTMENSINGDGKIVNWLNRNTAGTKGYASKEDMYKNRPEYKKALEDLAVLKNGYAGIQSVADKEISNMYTPESALATGKAKKTKKESAGGISLNESRNGATNITFNIDTFQKNEFSKDGVSGTLADSAKNALDQMGIALLQIINDGQIAAVR